MANSPVKMTFESPAIDTNIPSITVSDFDTNAVSQRVGSSPKDCVSDSSNTNYNESNTIINTNINNGIDVDTVKDVIIETSSDSIVTTSKQITPPKTPDYVEFQALVNSLSELAYYTFHPTKKHNRGYTMVSYSNHVNRLVKFFQVCKGVDFFADGTYCMCLVMKSLAQMTEMCIRMNSNGKADYDKIKWPVVTGHSEEEIKLMRKLAYQVADGIVFRNEVITVLQ